MAALHLCPREALETDLVIRQMIRYFVPIALLTATAAAQMPPAAPQPDKETARAARPVIPNAEDLNPLAGEVQALAQEVKILRQELDRQHQEIEQMRRGAGGARDLQAADAQEATAAATAARLTTEAAAMRAAPAEPAARLPELRAPENSAEQTAAASEEEAYSIRFGKASLTPGGWVDFTSYFRSTNVGSGLGTSFASIPFNNTVQGGLSELRFTAQNSRITLRADENFGATRVFGYAEADFNGYLPSNAYVSTNSDSMRLRVYFTNLSRGRWEFLGGQSWSLLTPNRIGVSPFLSEIYNTLHLDTNYQLGLTYARQAQLRAVVHVTPAVAVGVSAENPEQYSGGAATFPALFSTTQTDLGSGSGAGGGTSTPTLHPDVIAKLSADPGWAHRHWHFETAGLLTGVAILTPASVTKAASSRDVREGGGVTAVANLPVTRGLHLILTGFWSDGGGRYIGGLGPGFVVAQQASKTGPFLAQLVHAGSGIAATEWQATRTTVLSATLSAAYFGRAFSRDPSTGELVGYGFAGSANSNNRVLREATFATQTTLWKQAGFGAVQMITQSSYIMRTPWWVAPDSPRDAHVFAGYATLRYVLP